MTDARLRCQAEASYYADNRKPMMILGKGNNFTMLSKSLLLKVWSRDQQNQHHLRIC